MERRLRGDGAALPVGPCPGSNVRLVSKPERAHPDWNYVLDTVFPRFGMWTGRATYERAVCFVQGFDLARGGQVHPLLHEWAQERYGATNIGWPWVLVRLTLGIPHEVLEGHDLGNLTEKQDKAAIALLEEALREVVPRVGSV